VGRDGRVRILDFGLAKLKGATKLTKDSSTLGTIHYMSPEQLRGEEVDHCSDIWSLGVVFYEMLAGDVPFKGDYDQAVAYSINNEKPEPISGIAPEHDEMLSKFLAKEPENRFQNLEEFTDEFGEGKRSKESKRLNRKQKYLIYSICLIALIIVGYFLITNVKFDISEDSVTEWENSIGVLPLKDLSPDRDQEWFCDGMAEQITSDLSKLPNLKVISRTSMIRYKDTNKSLPVIGEELDVAHILEGSIRKIGKRIRITVQLINTENDSHVWSEDYDKEYKDLFEVQDNVSEAIAINLLKTISGEEIGRVKEDRPKNLEAWEYYKRGEYMHGRFFTNSPRLDYFNKSEEFLKKAIELDPDYAPSYAELANLYHTYYHSNASTEEEKQKYMTLQEKYISAGFKIDPQSADLYGVNGLFLWTKGDISGVYESIKKALILEPHNDSFNLYMGQFYSARTLYYLALKFLTKAIEINPFGEVENSFAGKALAYYERSWVYNSLGKIKQAEMDILKALELNPNGIQLLNSHFIYLNNMKRFAEAEKILRKIEELRPNNEWNKRFESYFYAMKGDKEKAFENFPEGSYYVFISLKMVDESIGELNKGLEKNKKSEKSGYLFLSETNWFDFLSSDPRFHEILKEEKKLYDELLEKYPDIDL
jgi:non-specific serine/threonine protein kinase